MSDNKKIVSGLFEKFDLVRREVPSAGTKYRLLGLAADVNEIALLLEQRVLSPLREEALIGIDDDVDYWELSEQVLGQEISVLSADLSEMTSQVNASLGVLNGVLSDIAKQLERRHSAEEYERLYDAERRRYLASSTARSARKNYAKWKENGCYGSPSVEDMDDYRIEKLLHMFEKGVFSWKVDHLQRAKRYPQEIDFEQLDDDHPLKKTAYKHYAALRKIVDYEDGYLTVNASRAGQYFYAGRHEGNSKAIRTFFLKYMHKIEMVQDDRRRLLAEEERTGNKNDNPKLNYFAPTKNLKVLLSQEWFTKHRTDSRYDSKWTDSFVDELMSSEYRDVIASEWEQSRRRDYMRGCVVGLLREGGVLKGSMDSIARSAGVCENYRTMSKYMGQCRGEPYAEWVLGYLHPADE